MRKSIYGLLVILMGVGSVSAKVHTNKHFLMPRSHNENLAMEYSTWHKQFAEIDHEKWGGAIQATGFYQASTNKTDLGKYFGVYNWQTPQQKINDFIWVEKDTANGAHLKSINVIHDPNTLIARGTTLHVKATFRPEQESYGVRLDYHQKLDKLAEGLYFKVSAPIVHVKNNMGLKFTGTKTTQYLPGTTTSVSFENYLKGSLSVTNTQQALTHARMGGSDSTTGVADIDVTLGYNFLYKDNKHFNANVCLTIPTGGTPDGVKRFEAGVGNGGHYALGCGIDGAFELWKKEDKSLDVIFAANYKYLFNATEKRTLDFKYSDSISNSSLAGKRVLFGPYRLGAKDGGHILFPLANVLTRDVGVEPGSQFEGLLNLAFNWGSFTFDVGYNLFAREAENVSVKSWPNTSYAMVKETAAFPYNTSGVQQTFDADSVTYAYDGTSDTVQVPIHKDHLLTDAATNPVYVTHKIASGVGYNFVDWKYPMMVGIGGSWEFVQGSNAALDGYALWAKLGVSF